VELLGLLDQSFRPVAVNLGFFVAGSIMGAAVRDWLERRRNGRKRP